MNTRNDQLVKSARRVLALLVFAGLCAALSSCGGGSSGGGGQPPPQLKVLTWDQGNWDEAEWK